MYRVTIQGTLVTVEWQSCPDIDFGYWTVWDASVEGEEHYVLLGKTYRPVRELMDVDRDTVLRLLSHYRTHVEWSDPIYVDVSGRC